MKTTVIFDLDGLLINSEIISYRLYQDLLETYGHSFTVEEYARNYSGKTGVGNMNIRCHSLKLFSRYLHIRNTDYINSAGICCLNSCLTVFQHQTSSRNLPRLFAGL